MPSQEKPAKENLSRQHVSLAVLRVGQWASALTAFVSFFLLFNYIGRHKLGTSARMGGVVKMVCLLTNHPQSDRQHSENHTAHLFPESGSFGLFYPGHLYSPCRQAPEATVLAQASKALGSGRPRHDRSLYRRDHRIEYRWTTGELLRTYSGEL